MGDNRIRTLELLGCLGLALVALRPMPAIERGLDALLVPLRPLASLSLPFASGGVVLADSEEARAQLAEERAASEALDALVRARAVPTRALDREVWPVHAEVLGRVGRDLDTLRVRVDERGVVRLGQPVVAGDVYVGRVSSVEPDEDPDDPPPFEVVRVALVTGRSARVGAQVLDADSGGVSARLVVGGLLPSVAFGLDERAQVLCAHYLSPANVQTGRVVVDEPDPAEPLFHAHGFLLGHITHGSSEQRTRRRLHGVTTVVDFATGLNQVLILCDADEAGRAPLAGADGSGEWCAARLGLRADTAAGRAGRKLLLGHTSGVRAGAAVARGPRFYGRVVRAGLFHSDVRTLLDDGLILTAIAAWSEGLESRSHTLGRVVSRGVDGEGRLVLDWEGGRPYEGEPVEVQLWTGSGEAGVPRGLLLGSARLERFAPGAARQLRVMLPEGARETGGLSVFVGEEALR